MDIEKLGSYRIVGVLGTGAMGVVYKAIHEPTGKVAAIKVMSGDIAQRGKAGERFLREMEILKQFRHRNIVRFLGYGRSKGISYFAMEYIQGRTLEQLLKDRGALDWKEVVELSRQLCDALHYAHEHGVVHRDLKPSNLMVTDDGRIKLTDFGIAKDLDATALTATGRTMGTAAYMAPEQIRGTPEVSHKTDLYALGIVLYQMLTGDLPFGGTSHMVLMHAHINAPIPRASDKLHEIPKALDELIYKLMNKEPNDRPWDAAAVAETLGSILEKAKKGQAVAMVWPTGDGGDALAPTQAASSLDATSAPAKPKSGKSRAKRRNAPKEEVDGHQRLRRRLETAGLVAALLGMLGLGAMLYRRYNSQEYLYENAKALMASQEPTDWATARDRWFTKLERNYPENPYKKEIRVWRDQILLNEVQRRAKSLVRLKNANDDNERRFLISNTEAEVALGQGDHAKAAAIWDEFAAELRPDSSEDDRQWFLFANATAKELKDGIERRQIEVVSLLKKAEAAEATGDLRTARDLRARVRKDFEKYKDAREILESVGKAADATGTEVEARDDP